MINIAINDNYTHPTFVIGFIWGLVVKFYEHEYAIMFGYIKIKKKTDS